MATLDSTIDRLEWYYSAHPAVQPTLVELRNGSEATAEKAKSIC